MERQDCAVASVVNITIDGGVSVHQKISVPSEAKIAVNQRVTKSAAKVIAVAQGKHGPALEVAYFGITPETSALAWTPPSRIKLAAIGKNDFGEIDSMLNPRC